jgi:hypothetical protein
MGCAMWVRIYSRCNDGILLLSVIAEWGRWKESKAVVVEVKLGVCRQYLFDLQDCVSWFNLQLALVVARIFLRVDDFDVEFVRIHLEPKVVLV